ncbi:uncharacterized protein LOC111331944 isoform X2 [Stylophora pistillata]|uniref:uncharacterized protein LOC111331944 isoform X2 n=1 Tax=Stylophora pistillata TaxID=50429 RepID=UPI000C04E240|nr:uncharacterized protein LOC111331944 isoform X2 [Stylophora pistillata]
MVTLIKNEIGNFYEDLGALLGVREGDLDDIETRYSRPTEKGGAVLKNWRDREGPQATVGRLETALNRLGKKRIAVRLLDIAREEKRTEDGSEEHRKTFSSPLEEGETGQRQDSERGFPETMPSSAVEPANAPRKRNVEQRERRAETGSEQGKLDELRESIEKMNFQGDSGIREGTSL